MAETKYGKYFYRYNPALTHPLGPMIARMDSKTFQGCQFYMVHWIMPGKSEARFGTDRPFAGHPPHIHKDGELLFHIGTDPEHPQDLGGEAIIYLGPELEKHTIIESCVIWIPPNFIHSPWRPVNTKRPWIFIEVNQGPFHTEKSYRQLLPTDEREKIDWANRWKDEGYEAINEIRPYGRLAQRVSAAYTILEQKCLKCGLCVTRCPTSAIVAEDRVTEPDGLVRYTTRIDGAKCTACGVCVSEEWWCPAQAIGKA